MVDVPRVRLGTQSDGTYGLRISKAGYDVTTNPPNNENLLYNSDWPETLPIWYQIKVSLATGTVTDVAFTALPFYPWATVQYGSLTSNNLETQVTSGFVFVLVEKNNLRVSQATGAAIDILVTIYNLEAFP